MSKNLKMASFLLLFTFCFTWTSNAQIKKFREIKGTNELVFEFSPMDDELNASKGNNKAVLEQLYAAIDRYRNKIVSGVMPIVVEGYSTSANDKEKICRLHIDVLIA